VAAKTRQKRDYRSAAHRRSYARRTGAERTFATAKDPATNNITRGWCRLTGLAPLTFWLARLLAVRNQRILAAWDARQHDNARRAAAGLPPRTRHRRRKTLTDLPPQAPRPDTAGEPGTVTRTPQLMHARPANPAQTARQARSNPGNVPTAAATRNVRPKREDKPRSNVKTFWSPVTESDRRPSPYHKHGPVHRAHWLHRSRGLSH
jgi:hypothetical protein